MSCDAKSNTLANQVLLLLYNGTGISGLAANAASPLTVLYLSLHTADPGASGNQSTSEATYTGYNRISVGRSGSGFAVSGSSASLVADASFGICTAGSQSLTHFAVGTAPSGSGQILHRGPLAGTIPVAPGVTPILNAGTLIQES